MFHTTKNLMAAGGVLVSAVRDKDYLGAETVDAAIEVLGAANAYRAAGPFSAKAGADEDVSGKSDDELAEIVAENEPQGFGAAGDAEAVGMIPPVVIAALIELAVRLIRKRFNF